MTIQLQLRTGLTDVLTRASAGVFCGVALAAGFSSSSEELSSGKDSFFPGAPLAGVFTAVLVGVFCGAGLAAGFVSSSCDNHSFWLVVPGFVAGPLLILTIGILFGAHQREIERGERGERGRRERRESERREREVRERERGERERERTTFAV